MKEGAAGILLSLCQIGGGAIAQRSDSRGLEMDTKSECITILGSPDFKSFLLKEARREGVSVSELVRRRCQSTPSGEDEQLLKELVSQVREVTRRANQSLNRGLVTAERVMKELRRKGL